MVILSMTPIDVQDFKVYAIDIYILSDEDDTVSEPNIEEQADLLHICFYATGI